MTTRYSPAVKNGVLNSTGIKEQFNLSFLYIFAGTEPATAEEALDMVAVHTEIVKVSNNSTATGLTFENPADGKIVKETTETWAGLNTFDGFEDAETDLDPMFYRLCAAGDNGRGLANASTGYRFQGSCGGPGSGRNMILGSATLTAGDTQAIEDYEIEAV